MEKAKCECEEYMRYLPKLTRRQTQVLANIAKGKTNQQIAEALGITERTVKNYTRDIFQKLNVANRTQAAMLYTFSSQDRMLELKVFFRRIAIWLRSDGNGSC